ncbi:uncharacterized protein LOC108989133 isoform X1 [Juglans regia]|uniref:Uncharacterized protein LOC108989133 isoform X1 n=1 Tax=Juglans regia TaxID=51240 RepID=A0A6P9ETB1_JUGRE|nr:uncharacterized protein LOC108989133 isoform X1 [Juglans regia]
MKLGLYFCLLSGNILLGFSLFAAFGAFPPTIDATMTLSSVQHYQCIKKAGQPNYFRQFQVSFSACMYVYYFSCQFTAYIISMNASRFHHNKHISGNCRKSQASMSLIQSPVVDQSVYFP